MKLNTPATDEFTSIYSAKDAERASLARVFVRRWWVWIVVALTIGFVAYRLLSGGKAREAAADAPAVTARQGVPIAAAIARAGDFNRYLTALGTVTPFNTVTVKSRVDGQLQRVDFIEGQMVRAGDLLVEIDPRPFQVQLAQAEGQLERDRASLVNARLTLNRDRTLFEHNVIAKQDLDNQQSLADQFRGAVVADQASIDSAKLQLTYSRITAPITGRIGLRLVDPGNIVHATDTQGLAVITQLQPIAVLFSIPEDDLPGVLADLKSTAALPVDAYDRDLKKKLAVGSLLTLDNQIDQNTGTIRLKARFSNADNALFPNQFVNARLLLDTIRNTVLIPAAAVQRNSQGAYVYVVKSDQTVDVRMLTVGALQGDQASVASGLNPGEMVVTDGVDKLQQGSRVRLQPGLSTLAQQGRQ